MNWNLTSEKLPELGSQVEISEDKNSSEGTAYYQNERHCMLAGTAGGFGYFGEGFATDGSTGCETGLIIDTPKYWRYLE